MNKLATFWDRAAFFALLFILFFAPLPLASNRVWAIGLLSCMVSLMFLMTISTSLLLNKSFKTLVQAVIPLSFLILYAVIQAWQYWSPGCQFWSDCMNDQALILTNDRFATKVQLILTIDCILLFVSTLLLCDTTNRIKLLMWGMVFSGTFQAIFAIMMYSIGANYQIFFFDVDHAKRALGTFGYHNSFAGYMEITLSCGLGLLLASSAASASKEAGTKARAVFNKIVEFVFSPKMPLRMALILMVVALVLTRSRMGNAGFMLALIVALLIAYFNIGRLKGFLLWLVISVVAIDGIILGQWIGIDKVIQRLENTAVQTQVENGGFNQESVEQRIDPAYNAIDMVKKRPWFGYGAGSFYITFVPFKSKNQASNFYDHAHNDYLEFLVDVGIVGLALLLLYTLCGFVKAVKLLRNTDPIYQGVGFTGLLMILSMALHSTVDFNLHMPANIVSIVAITALIWCKARSN